MEWRRRPFTKSSCTTLLRTKCLFPAGAAKMGGWIVEGTGFVIDQTDLESGEEWTARDFDPRNLGYKKVQG